MGDQFNQTDFYTGVAIGIAALLIVPAVTILLLCDLWRWARGGGRRRQESRRGFEVKNDLHKP